MADGRAYDGTYIARLVGAGEGPKKVLTVEKGDTITFSAQAMWLDAGMAVAAASGPATMLRVVPLITAAPLVPANAGVTGVDGNRKPGGLLSRLSFGISLTGFGGKKQPRPMASLTGTPPNVLIRYRYYDANHVQQGGDVTKAVSGASSAWELLQLGFRAPDAGTVEVTVLNASANTTLFDHIEVKQTGNPIVQEQHTYAFGSPLIGLNYAVGNRRYRHGYQGKFAEKDEETGYDSFDLRLYNSRIGRWTAPDPEGQFESPYVGMGNNPAFEVDPDGGFSLAGNVPNPKFRLIGQGLSNGSGAIGRASLQAGMSAARALGIGSAGPNRQGPPKIAPLKQRPDLRALGNQMRDQLDSGFEKDMFENYYLGKGDVHLSKERFESIAKASGKVEIKENMKTVMFNGHKAYMKIVSFYKNPEYDGALGSATVYFNTSGNPIGLEDMYDFDGKDRGVRSFSAELKTRAVDFAAPFGNSYTFKRGVGLVKTGGAKPFHIYFP